MNDYYSYKPLVKLERAVALTGFPGCRPLQTARVASMITGVSALLLSRKVSHHLGKTVEGLIRDGETASLHGAEKMLLERGVGGRSQPIIALGPTTLDDPELRDWVVKHCDIVYLEQTLTEAVGAIEVQMREDRRKHRHLDVFAPLGAPTLRPEFDRRTALFEAVAHRTIAVAGRGPLAVGRQIPDALGWVVAG